MNYYVDPVTGKLVLNGELENDSYRGEPFGNVSYRFEFSDKDNHTLLERNITLTDNPPIKNGVAIPPLTTFPFQVTLDNIDIKTVQKSSNFGVDGTLTLDYYPWKPADLVVSLHSLTSQGTISGKNGDVFTKWQVSGNITNTNSNKTQNVYVVASLRDKNDGIVGVAGYSDDSIQPLILNGHETKNFILYALVSSSKTPSKVNLYAESDDSSMIFQYYKPVVMKDAMDNEEKQVTDPTKPITISANIINTSRENLTFNWIIQIKKSPKSISEGDATEYQQSKTVLVKTIPGQIGAQKSTKLEYSWFPKSNGIYFYEMFLWDSSNAKTLSYPFRQGFLTDNILFVQSNPNSVPAQIKAGISLDKIQCMEDLQKIHKSSNGNLVCVTHDTAQKLVKRGWASYGDSEKISNDNQTMQREITILSISPQNVTLPEPKHPPRQSSSSFKPE